MRELDDGMNEIKQSNMNAEIPSNLVNSLNDIIMEGAPSTIIHVIRQQVEELSQVVSTKRFSTDNLRNRMTDLQERFNATLQCTVGSSLLPSSDPSLQTSDRQMNEMRSSQKGCVFQGVRDCEKGIERLEKQILQYPNIYISKDQINIALVKKCKTTDIPALNSAIANIQKALQKYVGFSGMDPEYCDWIGELLDEAQAWCQDIEELYNKAKVHSINTSQGDAAEIRIFSDNYQVIVFKFLESAELASLGWGNSIQKANRLCNKHISDEIKSHLINISDNYSLMKTQLITNYGGPVRIVGDIVSNLSRKSKPMPGNRKKKFSFYSAITGSIHRLERLSRVSYIQSPLYSACMNMANPTGIADPT